MVVEDKLNKINSLLHSGIQYRLQCKPLLKYSSVNPEQNDIARNTCTYMNVHKNTKIQKYRKSTNPPLSPI